MTEDQSNAALAAMTAKREQELAGADAHYRLRKACTARAVELFYALLYESGRTDGKAIINMDYATVDKLISDIEKDAQS